MWRAAVVIAYAALTALMTWPFVNYGHFADSSYGGDARLIIWTTAWANHAVLNGLPLFDANIFFPAPGSLRYNEHLLGVSLATLPWAAAGASPVLAYNATWWLAFFLNGVAAFAWLRRFAIDAQPAFVGSLVFACSFYVMLHAHGHLHLIWLWPLPLSALLLERWFVAPTLARAAAWLAAVLMGLLTSWYIAVMVALVNAIAGAALLVFALRTARTDKAWGRRAVHLAAAAVIAGAVVDPMARPYVSLRANQTEAAAFSADFEAYLVPPEHTLVGRWWRANVDARPRSIYGETTLFAGWIAIGLGLSGLSRCHGPAYPEVAWVFPLLASRRVLAVSGTCPAAAWGSALAPFGWLARLPGFSGMRAPGGLRCLHAGAVRAGRAGGLGDQPGGAAWAPCSWRRSMPLMLLEWFVVDFPARQARSAPHSRHLPDAGTPLGPRNRLASRVSRPCRIGSWAATTSTTRPPTGGPLSTASGAASRSNQPEVARRRFDSLRVRPCRRPQLWACSTWSSTRTVSGREDRGIIDAARANPGVRLAAQIGSDYLFEVLE